MSVRAMKLLSLCSALAFASAAEAQATPGRVSMAVSGAKAGSVEMRDAGFCVTERIVGSQTYKIFAFVGNNAEWSVSITSLRGLPAIGPHVVSPTKPLGVTARFIDKATSKDPAQQSRYDAMEGTVTMARSDSTHIAGSYRLTAKHAYPAAAEKTVIVDGTFDAGLSPSCSKTKAPGSGGER
jgi:hypothetical protein